MQLLHLTFAFLDQPRVGTKRQKFATAWTQIGVTCRTGWDRNKRLRPEPRLVLEFEPIAFASLANGRASWQITPALVADAGEQ